MRRYRRSLVSLSSQYSLSIFSLPSFSFASSAPSSSVNQSFRVSSSPYALLVLQFSLLALSRCHFPLELPTCLYFNPILYLCPFCLSLLYFSYSLGLPSGFLESFVSFLFFCPLSVLLFTRLLSQLIFLWTYLFPKYIWTCESPPISLPFPPLRSVPF